MTKVATLLSQIKGKLPKAIQTRITKLENLEKELEKAKELNIKEPSDANQEAFNEIDGLVTELSDSIAPQLEAIIVEESKIPPVEPITPATPAEPITPATPAEPITPATPAEPVQPVAPIVPPTEPITPAEPVADEKKANKWWIAGALGAALTVVAAVFLMKPKE